MTRQITIHLSVLAILGFVAVGCHREEAGAPDTGSPPQTTAQNGTNATATADSTTKDEAVAAAQRAISDIDRAIDRLTQRSTNYTGDARNRADEALANLRAKRDVAAQNLDHLKAASKDAWRDVKAGFDQAWQQVKETYAQVKQDFSE